MPFSCFSFCLGNLKIGNWCMIWVYWTKQSICDTMIFHGCFCYCYCFCYDTFFGICRVILEHFPPLASAGGIELLMPARYSKLLEPIVPLGQERYTGGYVKSLTTSAVILYVRPLQKDIEIEVSVIGEWFNPFSWNVTSSCKPNNITMHVDIAELRACNANDDYPTPGSH